MSTHPPQPELIAIIDAALPLLARGEAYSEALSASHETGSSTLGSFPVVGDIAAVVPGLLNSRERGGRLAELQNAQLGLQADRDELVALGATATTDQIRAVAQRALGRLQATAAQIRRWDTRTDPNLLDRMGNVVMSPDKQDKQFGMRVTWAAQAGAQLTQLISRCEQLV